MDWSLPARTWVRGRAGSAYRVPSGGMVIGITGSGTRPRTAPSPWAVAVIAVAAVAAAIGSYALAFRSDHLTQPLLHASLFVWISQAYILCGLVAWWRRPASRLGPLMVVAGFTAALSNLAWSNDPVVQSLGLVFDLVPAILFIHVFLAFPDGRLLTRFDRFLVGCGYVVSVPGQIAVMLMGGFGTDNPFTLVEWTGFATVVYHAILMIISAVALAALAVLVRRRRGRGRPRRRAVTLLLDAFALGLVMIAVLLTWGMLAAPGFVIVQRVTLVVLGLAPLAFLIGLLDTYLGRAAAGNLFVRLRDNPDNLRAVLAQALRDPSLVLLYWLPQYDTWADEDGQPSALPDGGTRAATVIEHDGAPLAALVHDPSLRDEPELLEAVTAAAAIALENGRLQAQLRAHVEELRGSRFRVLEAGQRERQRLERNLHDGAQQRLIALSLDLGLLESRLGSDPAAKDALAKAKQEIALSLDELRDVARGLHPAVLSGHGLAVAVESVVARAPVPARLTVRLDGRLPESVEVAAYYVVCESLANVGKHARASLTTVDIERVDDLLVVEVVDDGIGGADTERGTGLRGLADRVEALGGRLRVWTPAGRGTRVRAEIPCG
jgi:signal transduction histidine kinase